MENNAGNDDAGYQCGKILREKVDGENKNNWKEKNEEEDC